MKLMTIMNVMINKMMIIMASGTGLILRRRKGLTEQVYVSARSGPGVD